MRRLAIALALIGLVIATAIAGYIGFGAVYRALLTFGWRGVAVLSVYSLAPLALLGSAWFALVPQSGLRRWWVLVGARAVRDAGAELLPFSHVGGFVLGARAAVLGGVPLAQASSTTVADVTTELIAQLGFVGLGLAILARHVGGGAHQGSLVQGGAVGLIVSIAGTAGLVALQRGALGPIERIVGRFAPGAAAAAAGFREALHALYRAPLRLGLSVTIHFSAWIASAAGVWLALRLAGAPIDFSAVLAIESVVCAVRGAAFLAPMGIGVQEATYALIGPMFGLGPDFSLALSLLKRARDVVVGAPALLIWQGLESRRLVRTVGAQNDLGGGGLTS